MFYEMKGALTEEQVAKANQNLDSLDEIFASVGHSLQQSERKEMLRAKLGSGPVVDLALDMAKEKGLALDEKPMGEIEEARALRIQLPSLIHRLESLLQLANDTLLAANGTLWDGFLGYYRVLGAIAKGDAETARRLKPVSEFMARSVRKGAKAIKAASTEEESI